MNTQTFKYLKTIYLPVAKCFEDIFTITKEIRMETSMYIR